MQVIYRNSSLTHAWLNEFIRPAQPLFHLLISFFLLPSSYLFFYCFTFLVSLNEERQYSSSPNSRIGWIHAPIQHCITQRTIPKRNFPKSRGPKNPNPPKALPNLGRHQKEMKLNTSPSSLLPGPLHRIVRFGPKSCPVRFN